MKHFMSVKVFQKGRPRIASDAVYNSIHEPFDNLQDRLLPVTAKMLINEYCTQTGTKVNDELIRKRIHCWRKANGIVYWRVTSVAQNTCHNQETVDSFVKYVNEQIIIEKYTCNQIVNIDETNIYFDQTSKITLARRGDTTVSAMATGCTNCCTVLLGVTMDGRVLPPFIVFIGKKSGRVVREWRGATDYPKSCLYTVQEKGWIDKITFLEWINLVWKPFCNGKTTTYLLMDEFAAHKSSQCTKEIENRGSQYDFIFGGYTSIRCGS
jgi:hypothetical protein